jgi:membrane associated rhomboid family serine protease
MISNALILLVLAATIHSVSAWIRGRGDPPRPTFPAATGFMALLVATGFAVQVFLPASLPLFERQGNAFARGDMWRILTPLFFQDGGWIGGAFNLLLLVLVGSAAERVWSRTRWLCIYLGCGIATQILGYRWQPVGAGNSVACLALSGSCFALGLYMSHSKILRASSLAGLLAGCTLLLMRDIHGIAVLLGVIAGATLIVVDRRRAAR